MIPTVHFIGIFLLCLGGVLVAWNHMPASVVGVSFRQTNLEHLAVKEGAYLFRDDRRKGI
jgi:hypothetical protein